MERSWLSAPSGRPEPGRRWRSASCSSGALAYGAAHKLGKSKAGGLPGQFVLAVTPDRLYAFRYKSGRNGITIKEEAASWDRAGLRVGTERLQTTTRVTLEWPDGGRIVCDQEGLGDNPWAEDVIRELQA